jgi:DNA-binding beta-propeller fold protein YncE
MVAIGTADGPIEIHSLATGEHISSFGSRGRGPSQIELFATDIRFTPDRACLLVAEWGTDGRLSLFTVEGVFIKHIGTGVLAAWSNNYVSFMVSFGACGEIMVADSGNHRICVFSPDSDTLIKTWGSEGTADGQFQVPHALAVSGSYLFVMDNKRVQVFE